MRRLIVAYAFGGSFRNLQVALADHIANRFISFCEVPACISMKARGYEPQIYHKFSD